MEGQNRQSARGSDSHPADEHRSGVSESRIGPTLNIRGALRSREQDLRILGHVEGVIDHDGRLIVDEQGSVDATLVCRELNAAGRISGDIYATERVVIASTGKVNGNVFAPLFSMIEGANLEGSVEMNLNKDALEAQFKDQVAKSGGQPLRSIRHDVTGEAAETEAAQPDHSGSAT